MRAAHLARGLALTLAAAAGPAAAERTLALVIGIDSYAHIPSLAGAVNDARDIAGALDALGAETTLLLNEAASRDAILSAWEGLAAQAGPGDRLIVTYAGHGSNEAEAIAGEEADGRDENWLLSGFSPFGADSGERIRDNEIASLIALSPAAEVILISDSCHSGTVSREIAPVLGYRYFRTDGTLADDPLPPPPPPPAGGELADVALYMGAVPDSERVPEFLIGEAPRGALSFAFAAGLRGGADADGDGRVTGTELESFVRAEVREISRGLQRPQIAAALSGAELAFGTGTVQLAALEADPAPDPAPEPAPVPAPEVAPMVTDAGPDGMAAPAVDDGPLPGPAPESRPGPGAPGALSAADPADPSLPQVDLSPGEGPSPDAPLPDPAAPPKSVAQDPFLTAFADLPPVSLSASAGDLPVLDGAVLRPTGQPADLVYDPATGLLRSMVGDVFAEVGLPGDGGFADRLQLAVDNARLAAALGAAHGWAALDVRFAEGDGTYRDGDRITVGVAGRQTPHLALFNIAPDGTVTPLYPLHAPDLGISDPDTLPPGDMLDIAMQVGAPFGSDFLLAVETARPSPAIGLLLADPLQSWSAEDIWSALRMSRDEGAAPVVAVFPFHSLRQ